MQCGKIKIFIIFLFVCVFNAYAKLELYVDQLSREACTIKTNGFIAINHYSRQLNITFNPASQPIIINNCNFITVDKGKKLIKVFGGFIDLKNCNARNCKAIANVKKIKTSPVNSGLNTLEIADVIGENLNMIVASNKNNFISKKRKGKLVIAIDAGHGGKDPGTISRRKNKEKNITLKYAKYLKKVLEQDGNKVYLVRDRDVYIALHSRIDKAMKQNADIFISIHADAAKNKKARGATIYALSPKSINDATLKAERRTNISGNFLDNSSDKDLVFNILNIQHSANVKQSFEFAKNLKVKLQNNGVKLTASPIRSANFAVLKAPLFPAILLEIGYLSNWEDDRLIQSFSYMNKVTNSVKQAIRDIK